MSLFKKKFFSIILLGRQNPQILNHDFLINNKILPEDVEPFKSILAKQAKPNSKPFTDFISSPVITTIKYGYISLAVQENSYQIIDKNYENPESSPIIKITENYFGKFLKYTPFKIGGINLNGTIQFSDKADEFNFDQKIGINREILCTHSGSNNLSVGISFNFPWESETIEVTVNKPKVSPQIGNINFNYEFKYNDNIDAFLGNLGKVGQINNKFIEFIKKLDVEVNQ